MNHVPFTGCLGCGFYDPDYGCMSGHDWECPDYDGPLPWEDDYED